MIFASSLFSCSAPGRATLPLRPPKLRPATAHKSSAEAVNVDFPNLARVVRRRALELGIGCDNLHRRRDDACNGVWID